MKHLLTLAIIAGTLPTCFGQQPNNNKVEAHLFQCLNNSYQKNQVDIVQTLDSFEKYLVRKGILHSTSGKAYHNFYKKIAKAGEIQASIDQEKFESIFKVEPHEFYSKQCLERLKKFDSSAMTNSRYFLLTRKIANAKKLTPAIIAEAITAALEPSDFEMPYYRTLALLSTAFISNPENGISVKIPNAKTSNNFGKNKFKFLLTDENKIEMNDTLVSKDVLKKRLRNFIKSHKAEHVVILSAQGGTAYQFYRNVHDLILQVYNDIRHKKAMTMFNKPYEELTERKKEEIKEVYPVKIKEEINSR